MMRPKWCDSVSCLCTHVTFLPCPNIPGFLFLMSIWGGVNFSNPLKLGMTMWVALATAMWVEVSILLSGWNHLRSLWWSPCSVFPCSTDKGNCVLKPSSKGCLGTSNISICWTRVRTGESGSVSGLKNQNLHFNEIPRWLLRTLKFEKHYWTSSLSLGHSVTL